MRELLSHNLKVNFLSKTPLFGVVSVIVVALSLYVWFSFGNAKYGTDFSGGHEFIVHFTDPVSSDDIRKTLTDSGEEDARVQAFQGGTSDYSIRLSTADNAEVIRGKVEAALGKAYPDKYSIVKTDYVGPTVGNELRSRALLAVALSLIGILLYIAFRFEFSVGLGSIVALAHDVIISTGIYLVSGHVISMATLAAALTIIGYSVNDTVVVFDRVREERAKRPNVDIGQLVNESLNFTLSRTIITHMLTFFSALALYVFGSGEIKDLSLYLVAGIFCGAYSTVFIVSPIAVAWERRKGNAGGRVKTVAEMKG